MSDPLDLDALATLAEQARPPPSDWLGLRILTSPTQIDGFAFPARREADERRIESDVEFILALVNAWPALIAALKEAQA